MFYWSWWHKEEASAACADKASSSVPTANTPPNPDTCISALLDNRFMLTLDNNYIIHYVSENTLTQLALTRDTLGTQPFHRLLHPSHQALFCNAENLPLQKRAQLKHHDGSFHWYALKYYPQPQGHLLVLEPINTLVKTEKNLRSAQMEVEYSAKERGEFLRHMSHELRTPLNAILGFAEMMECGVFGKISNQAYEEYLTLIRESGEDLLTKIVELMDLSAIGSQHVTLNESDIFAHDLMMHIVEGTKKLAVQRDITLSLHHSDQSIQLQADKKLLRKAVTHVLHNAIQYNRPEGGIVEVYAGMNAVGDYQISVQDNGQGIKSSRLKALKTALYQSDQLYSNVEAHHPVGLGLTLSKEYINLHGGDITIDSSTRKGTLVTLTIPNARVRVMESLCTPVKNDALVAS